MRYLEGSIVLTCLILGLAGCGHSNVRNAAGNVFHASSSDEFLEICARESKKKCALYVTRPACRTCDIDERLVFDPMSAKRPDVTFVKVFYRNTKSFFDRGMTKAWGKSIQARLFVFYRDRFEYTVGIATHVRSVAIPHI
ncbi:MAG: hypothetical protein ACR2RL_03895 [Gammaproteobacteria bacterium]